MAPQTTAFNLGKLSDGADLLLDRESLLRQKLLIQASSGGGKSRTLRRLAEQAFGQVPTIIIDPEGEFASLREKYDFLLVSKDGGDVPAEVDLAAPLAQRLLQTRVSAVIDLFEVKGPARHAFVAKLLESLMEASRDLWTDFLIMIDEGEGFCPEKGEGDSVAKSAVLDVAQRGRKRGYSLILATLRVARLDKTCLAELHNKLVGLTTMDTDLDRASSTMGIRSGKPKHEFQTQLSDLDPGHFFARGPGFEPRCKIPTAVHIGDVVTTHPKPGARKQLPPPPPTAKIKHLLPSFADLPTEAKAEEEAMGKVEAELRAEIANLQEENGRISKALDTAEDNTRVALERAQIAEEGAAEAPQTAVPEGLPELFDKLVLALDGAGGKLNELAVTMTSLVAEVGHVQHGLPPAGAPAPRPVQPPPRTFMLGDQHTEHVSRSQVRREREQRNGTSSNGEWKVRGGVRRMLVALATTWNPDGLTERQLATLAKIAITGGTWNTYMGELRVHGCVVESGDYLKLTAEGRRLAAPFVGSQRRPVGGAAIFDFWIAQPVVRGKCRDMLSYIVKKVGRGRYVDKETWGSACDVAPTGGTLGTYIGLLSANGLVIRGKPGYYTPADFFYS